MALDYPDAAGDDGDGGRCPIAADSLPSPLPWKHGRWLAETTEADWTADYANQRESGKFGFRSTKFETNSND